MDLNANTTNIHANSRKTNLQIAIQIITKDTLKLNKDLVHFSTYPNYCLLRIHN